MHLRLSAKSDPCFKPRNGICGDECHILFEESMVLAERPKYAGKVPRVLQHRIADLFATKTLVQQSLLHTSPCVFQFETPCTCFGIIIFINPPCSMPLK